MKLRAKISLFSARAVALTVLRRPRRRRLGHPMSPRRRWNRTPRSRRRSALVSLLTGDRSADGDLNDALEKDRSGTSDSCIDPDLRHPDTCVSFDTPVLHYQDLVPKPDPASGPEGRTDRGGLPAGSRDSTGEETLFLLLSLSPSSPPSEFRPPMPSRPRFRARRAPHPGGRAPGQGDTAARARARSRRRDRPARPAIQLMAETIEGPRRS